MAAPDLRSMTVYVDGRIVPGDQAVISVFDHGLLYGDGVFEGIRVYDGRVFRCRQHIERIYESAKAIALEIPMEPPALVEAMCETVRASGLRDAYIRLVVTRGVGDLGLDPRKCPRPSVIIIVGGITLYPPEYYRQGLDLITVATRRNSPTALAPSIKSLNYLNNILAKIEVSAAGCLEGVMLNQEGYVAECTGDNIFIVADGELLTPPPHCGILVGVTRGAVMDIAKERGIQVREPVLTVQDLYRADECFLTGTAAEIIPVVSLDRRKIGTGTPGPVTAELQEAFVELRTRDGHLVYPD